MGDTCHVISKNALALPGKISCVCLHNLMLTGVSSNLNMHVLSVGRTTAPSPTKGKESLNMSFDRSPFVLYKTAFTFRKAFLRDAYSF